MQISPEDQKTAFELSDLVGALPIAITVISGYIRASHSSPSEALKLFRSQPSFIWDTEISDTPWRKAKQLSALWDFALSELTDDAKNLAYILAYLNPDSVPEAFLLVDSCSQPWDGQPSFLISLAEFK